MTILKGILYRLLCCITLFFNMSTQRNRYTSITCRYTQRRHLYNYLHLLFKGGVRFVQVEVKQTVSKNKIFTKHHLIQFTL